MRSIYDVLRSINCRSSLHQHVPIPASEQFLLSVVAPRATRNPCFELRWHQSPSLTEGGGLTPRPSAKTGPASPLHAVTLCTQVLQALSQCLSLVTTIRVYFEVLRSTSTKQIYKFIFHFLYFQLNSDKSPVGSATSGGTDGTMVAVLTKSSFVFKLM